MSRDAVVFLLLVMIVFAFVLGVLVVKAGVL